MKKIITSSLFLALGFFTTTISAQDFSNNKRTAIQSDKVADFQTNFQRADYDKCHTVKTDSYTPLAYSAWNNKRNITNFLLQNGSNVNKACNGVTPLMSVAMFGNEAMVRLFLSKGADKNAKDNNNQTARDYAIRYGFNNVAELLR